MYSQKVTSTETLYSKYIRALNFENTCQAPFPPNTIASEINTGVVSARTFNHRIGTIGAARGGKEGNGAFIAW
jgi:hypothetical protein